MSENDKRIRRLTENAAHDVIHVVHKAEDDNVRMWRDAQRAGCQFALDQAAALAETMSKNLDTRVAGLLNKYYEARKTCLTN